MFDESQEPAPELPRDPVQRAREKADELCMYAEVAAVFEGTRKMDAQVRVGFDPDLARGVQRGVALLAKARTPEHPVLPPTSAGDAEGLLDWPHTRDLPTNDYHVYRRPGEVMIVRWLVGDEVEAFYERLQAHFDAALEGWRDDERQAHAWKQDAGTVAYLEALDKVQLSMADRYLRSVIREHKVFVLSTLTADEMNIAFIAEDAMGLPVGELTGAAPAEMDEAAAQRERAWFFKLFALRGLVRGVEAMCFFTFLQKTDDSLEGW